MEASLINYVSVFVPEHSGENLVPHLTSPHLTGGPGQTTYLEPVLSEPFLSFTFSLASAAVYQLGQFGTAAKKLKELGLKP